MWVKNPNTKRANRGPAKTLMAVLPSCKTPLRPDEVKIARPTVRAPAKAANPRVIITCGRN